MLPQHFSVNKWSFYSQRWSTSHNSRPEHLRSAVKTSPRTLHAVIFFNVSAAERGICQMSIFYDLIMMSREKKKFGFFAPSQRHECKESIIWFMLSPDSLRICFTEIEKRSQCKEEVRRKSCDLCVCPDHERTAVQPFIESGLECVFGAEQVLLVPASGCEEEGKTTCWTLLPLIMKCQHTVLIDNRRPLFRNKSSFHSKWKCTFSSGMYTFNYTHWMEFLLPAAVNVEIQTSFIRTNKSQIWPLSLVKWLMFSFCDRWLFLSWCCAANLI